MNWCCNTSEVQKEIHETLLQFTQNRKPNHITDSGIYFFSEIPPTAVPPVPLLVPSPEEKKPPAKRIEGTVCSLPKCEKYRI